MFDYNSLRGDSCPTSKKSPLELNSSRDMKDFTKVTIWDLPGPAAAVFSKRTEFAGKQRDNSRFYCLLLCISSAFAIGLCFGILGPFFYSSSSTTTTMGNSYEEIAQGYLSAEVLNSPPSEAFKSPEHQSNFPQIEGIFVNHSYSILDSNNSSSVTFVQDANDINEDLNETSESKDNLVVQPFVRKTPQRRRLVANDIFWSDYVESLLPQGFTRRQADEWNRYVRKGAIAVKLEKGCGRMQNRLVTFADGRQACVRYRQNTDQIQGELFSFYLTQILGLRNLVPSAIGVVDVKLPLWGRLSNEIASAQWNSQRPVVLTQYISDLDVGSIPKLVRPAESHHMNKLELEGGDDAQALRTEEIVELAQWSDLIIFDYLTANLDRVVNNLYNHQWNNNIMEAPAHNLAKNIVTNLLVFLDNESGLLHGYRLLEKYEAYHGLLLDNLCIFRRSTAQAIGTLRREGNVGHLLNAMFERRNPEQIKDVLPTIPEKSVKILNGRIRRVHEQILKCQGLFTST